jgi:hypothetical protein
MKMTILKQKIQKMVSEHPTLVTFGIALAITLAVGTVLGVAVEPQQANAERVCPYC